MTPFKNCYDGREYDVHNVWTSTVIIAEMITFNPINEIAFNPINEYYM